MMHIGGTSALGIFTFLSTPSSWPSIRGENGKVKFISFFETDHSARNFLTKSFPQTYTRSNKHHCYSDFLQFWTSNNLRRLTISFGKVVARILCPLSPPGTGRVVVPHFIIWKVVQVGREGSSIIGRPTPSSPNEVLPARDDWDSSDAGKKEI